MVVPRLDTANLLRAEHTKLAGARLEEVEERRRVALAEAPDPRQLHALLLREILDVQRDPLLTAGELVGEERHAHVHHRPVEAQLHAQVVARQLPAEAAEEACELTEVHRHHGAATRLVDGPSAVNSRASDCPGMLISSARSKR